MTSKSQLQKELNKLEEVITIEESKLQRLKKQKSSLCSKILTLTMGEGMQRTSPELANRIADDYFKGDSK